jgi:leucyl aminopeptidase
MLETKLEVVAPPFHSVMQYDLLVVVVPHNTSKLENAQDVTTDAIQDVIAYMLETKTKSVVRISNGTSMTRILVLELPEDESNSNDDDDDGDDCGAFGRKVAESVVSTLNTEKGVTSCGILLPEKCLSSTEKSSSFLSECSSSILSGLYADTRYKGKVEDDSNSVKTIDFIVTASSDDVDQKAVSVAVHRGVTLAKGVYLAKDIVNAPHNSLNSCGLATVAKTIAAQSGGRLSCRILETSDCEKRGMGAFLGVARGSETGPKLIHLTYKSKPRKRANKDIPLKKLGVVGKGLLFDTGGYNIKTAMMELMKFDCGGAAAVLGAAYTIATLQPEGVEVHFVVAACENMINERAVVPGDVLTAANGKTIEVLNTDAEGRLTMADALVYIDKEVGCDCIIELSTLTGSCIGALGTAMSGLWTDDEDLLETLKFAAKATGDKLWHMPLEKSYGDEIKSKVADLKNIGGKYAGAITAALFLTNFVDKKPFAHIDMAGPVWSAKIGATGWGTKLVTEWVCRKGE